MSPIGEKKIHDHRRNDNYLTKQSPKEPVKVIHLLKIAHSFLQSVKSAPRYHFKLAYILVMAVKGFFETHF